MFISYSWTSPEHTKRILSWAERLTSNGVHVVLDRWDLTEGQDKHAFMEKMVVDTTISKVLVFSDSAYAAKANQRTGGVGTESQIISQETYGKVEQTKFIPIVCEFQESRPCLPVFLASRIYIDFSSPERFHEECEKLVRQIFNKPLYSRPKIGTPPEYLNQERTTRFPSRYRLDRYKDAIENDRSHFRALAREYLRASGEDLAEHAPLEESEEADADDLVILRLKESLPLRDDLVEFLRISVCYKDDSDLYALIREWFESAAALREASGEIRDHVAFLIHELLLYYVAILIQNKRYSELQTLMEHRYVIASSGEGTQKLRSIDSFRSYCRSLEEGRKKRLKLNRLSLTADLLKERATLPFVKFSELQQADAVLFLKTLITEQSRAWYPVTLVYSRFNDVLDLFFRATSRRQFAPIQILFGVENKDELIDRFRRGGERHQLSRWTDLVFQAQVDFENLFNLDRLGSLDSCLSSVDPWRGFSASD